MMDRVAAVRPSDPTLRSLVADFLAEAPAELAIDDTLHSRFLDAALLDPAHDILRRRGKELRSRMFESCWILAGGAPGEHPEQLPLVVELLHTGSLVIDDIQDDSALRRGEPALHRRFGVPVALNTGNWLYFLPLALLSRMGLSDTLTLRLYADISDAVLLCHKGQALDLSTHVAAVRQSEMPQLVAQATQLKTGSLMRLAALLGARTAGAEGERLAALARFGAELGVGLQMLDDWSGLTVEARRRKGLEDIKLGRPTWPWAWLAESSDEVSYANLAQQARRLSIDWEAEGLLLELQSRLHDTAPETIHLRLQCALDSLSATLGPAAAMEGLAQQIADLERAFG
jgi:geranylgeranyl pyrophosphate synthase